MSMGTGAVYSTSRRQKLNTKSSTEAELVGINDVLPQALWTKYFMEAQGYGITTILNQDNQSAIKLSDNGNASSGKGSRHINIRYFSSPIALPARRLRSNTAPRKKWWPTTSQSPFKAHFFTSSGIKSWEWSLWILSPGTTGVY
jgi:hypothetical protein